MYEVKRSDVHGEGVFASDFIPEKCTIFEDEPFFSNVLCMCGSPSKMQCSGCNCAKFCSAECSKKFWKSHKQECKLMAPVVQTDGSFAPLLRSVALYTIRLSLGTASSLPESAVVPVTDPEFIESAEANWILLEPIMKEHPAFPSLEEYKRIASYFKAHSLTGMGGIRLFKTISKVNHCCFPNAMVCGNKLLSLMPIKQGAEITINYMNRIQASYPLMTRRALLQKRWGFRCTCIVCRPGVPRQWYEGLNHGIRCKECKLSIVKDLISSLGTGEPDKVFIRGQHVRAALLNNVYDVDGDAQVCHGDNGPPPFFVPSLTAPSVNDPLCCRCGASFESQYKHDSFRGPFHPGLPQSPLRNPIYSQVHEWLTTHKDARSAETIGKEVDRCLQQLLRSECHHDMGVDVSRTHTVFRGPMTGQGVPWTAWGGDQRLTPLTLINLGLLPTGAEWGLAQEETLDMTRAGKWRMRAMGSTVRCIFRAVVFEDIESLNRLQACLDDCRNSSLTAGREFAEMWRQMDSIIEKMRLRWENPEEVGFKAPAYTAGDSYKETPEEKRLREKEMNNVGHGVMTVSTFEERTSAAAVVETTTAAIQAAIDLCVRPLTAKEQELIHGRFFSMGECECKVPMKGRLNKPHVCNSEDCCRKL